MQSKGLCRGKGPNEAFTETTVSHIEQGTMSV